MAYSPLIPFVNATLTKIEGGGNPEDYDRPAGSEMQKWSGSAGAWLKESQQDQAGLDRDELLHDRIQFAATDLSGMTGTFALDDVVTYTHADSTAKRRVTLVEQFDTVGIVRLTFADA